MKIKLTLACAYCFSPVSWQQTEIALRGTKGQWLREQEIAVVQCPHCDSKFAVDVKTRRKSKGRRYKAVETEREAEHAERVRKAEAHNDEIAKRLLAEPGCECADKSKAGYSYGLRADGLLTGGVLKGVPQPPTHRYSCPLYPDHTHAAESKAS